MIAFQEVFSIDSLKKLLLENGYEYFSTVDTPQIIDDFIYKSPVVAIAAKYPIVEVAAVAHSREYVNALGLNHGFEFSRKVLRATINLPHIGYTDCYVVHLKSKRSMIEIDDVNHALSPEKNIIEILKATVAGGWGATIQRGSEATLLMLAMIEQRKKTNQPMILMGDFNNDLTDGVLNHLLTNSLRFAPQMDTKAYLAKYCLNDAWNLFENSRLNQAILSDLIADTQANTLNTGLVRKATHYYGANSNVLDYILLSCEFDSRCPDNFFDVSEHHTYDRHLLNPEYEKDDLTTDHAVICITLTLRN